MDNKLTPVPATPASLTPISRKPGQSITMSFPDAMKAILRGKSITRLSWTNGDYCLMKDSWLTIYTKGAFHTWLINDGDMEANDWIIKQ